MKPMILWLAVFCVLMGCGFCATAADSQAPNSGGQGPSSSDSAGHGWPMCRGNAQRDGHTPERLPDKLELCWVYKLPSQQSVVCHPIVSRGLVFLASSADGKVYALEAATGKEKWTFFTEAPIRFAPAVWKDRLFVGGDDGYLYCLECATGKLLWKQRGGPSDEKVMGDGRIVSRWPIRGGVAVFDDPSASSGQAVYFGAGIWPADKSYLCVLEAETGKTLLSAASEADGYRGRLAVSDKWVACPEGYPKCQVYDRATLKPLFTPGRGPSGASIVDSFLICSAGWFDLNTGKQLISSDPRCPFGDPNVVVAAMPDRVYGLGICGVDRKTPIEKNNFRGTWFYYSAKFPGDGAVNEMIGAGSRLYVNRGGFLCALDPGITNVVWQTSVPGAIHGLAAADGRLYASTDKGCLYCFGARTGAPVTNELARVVEPEDAGSVWSKAADEILKQGGMTEGWCVDLGCGDGSLTYELIRKSKLNVVAVEKDEALVRRARERLDNAGFYGERVFVLQADPEKTGLPKWFANLVVSGRSVEKGEGAVAVAEAHRIQRPYGGVLAIGKPGSVKKEVRGPLEGAGTWTHCLADSANTCCSGDNVLKGPLRSYWYKDAGGFMGFQSAPAPMFANGRLYVTGRTMIRAVDAYNGRILWDFPLKVNDPSVCCDISGFADKALGYVCAAPDGTLFARNGSNLILRIDGETGKQTAAFEAPAESDGKPAAWGFIAYDAGILYGALTFSYVVEKGQRPNPVFASSLSLLTAMDPATGKTKWTYKAKQCIPNSSIAIGAGRVYLVDYSSAAQGLSNSAAGAGELVALDAGDGKVLWRVAADVGYLVSTLSVKHGVLMVGNTVFRTSDGKELWKMNKRAAVLPVFNDRTAYFVASGKAEFQAMALDLATGERKLNEAGKPWTTPRLSKSCGSTSGSNNLLVFRSWDLGYCDLGRGSLRENYTGIRPGCFINAIPVGGLVLMPYAAECGCPFNIAWIALQGAD